MKAVLVAKSLFESCRKTFTGNSTKTVHARNNNDATHLLAKSKVKKTIYFTRRDTKHKYQYLLFDVFNTIICIESQSEGPSLYPNNIDTMPPTPLLPGRLVSAKSNEKKEEGLASRPNPPSP